MTPCVNVIKLSYSLLMKMPNESESALIKAIFKASLTLAEHTCKYRQGKITSMRQTLLVILPLHQLSMKKVLNGLQHVSMLLICIIYKLRNNLNVKKCFTLAVFRQVWYFQNILANIDILLLILLLHQWSIKKVYWGCHQVSMLLNLFSLLLMTRPNKLESLHLAISFQSSLTFAGNFRSLPKKEASERCYNWVFSGLALKF
jgi:hypothetical protein